MRGQGWALKYTEEFVERARKLWAKGLLRKQISHELGIPVYILDYVVRTRGGFSPRKEPHSPEFIEAAREMWNERGWSEGKIGAKLGVNKDVISGIARRNGFDSRYATLKSLQRARRGVGLEASP